MVPLIKGVGRLDMPATELLGEEALAAERGEETTVMIDATHLKAHRTASSLGVKKAGVGV